jgi:hypothetical protein
MRRLAERSLYHYPFSRGATASVVSLNDFGQIAGNFTAGGTLFAYYRM